MILPKEVKTRHKIRDFKIVQLYSQGKTQKEIAQLFGFSHQAISNIISKNRHLLKLDIEFEKAKRVFRLKRILAKTGDELSPKKDVLNVISEIRSELEGDTEKGTIINNITYNIQGERKRRLELIENNDNQSH